MTGHIYTTPDMSLCQKMLWRKKQKNRAQKYTVHITEWPFSSEDLYRADGLLIIIAL